MIMYDKAYDKHIIKRLINISLKCKAFLCTDEMHLFDTFILSKERKNKSKSSGQSNLELWSVT